MYKVETKNLDLYYGTNHALKKVTMGINENTVVAMIGPSGCGKSTYLRLFNRMNDLIDNVRIEGEALLNGKNIYNGSMRVEEIRKKIGMVFQKPNPFPKTIFENVAYGLRINGVSNKQFIEETVERSLRQAALWEEVKDDLKKSALAISGGQQQRLCIARSARRRTFRYPDG
jgi:phosphate transport system ATP-binding protein